MGLLSDLGEILGTEESAALQPFLKELGIRQFVKVFKKYKGWKKIIKHSIIKWGQEIEGHFLEFDEKNELVLSNCQLSEEYKNLDFPLMLEYGRWMLEMTPSEPYEMECDFSEAIRLIKAKYEVLQSKSKMMLTIPTIPFLGVRNPEKQQEFDNTITQSLYVDDNHIADHIRFRVLTKNIRARRGGKVEINVPLFMDKHTNLQQIAVTQPNPNGIYLDAMAFGMGMACLQCTFSTQNLDHARYVYDQMHVISPLFLAITAGTPFHKGKIGDWDSRWNIISGSVDCRNAEERNPKHPKYLPTSRYSQSLLYLWPGPFNKHEYNDVDPNLKEQNLSYLKKTCETSDIEIDDYLIKHIANIFNRDILIVHEKFKTMSDDENTIFEMLNGTNWNSVRLKIPIDDTIGWRVEFRTMEVQLMAEENAAYSLFIHLFTRALHSHKNLNLYIPISKVSENFQRAHRRDAVRTVKFWFRVNIFDEGAPIMKEMTLHQILFGLQHYPGIFHFVEKSLLEETPCCKKKIVEILSNIKNFMKSITSGKRLTLAQWMRQFVAKHPDYKHNSILPKKVMDDLLIRLNDISKGTVMDPNFTKIFD